MKLIIKYYKLILITMVVSGLAVAFVGKYFLIVNTDHLSDTFYQQNFKLLESGDALALVPQLNALIGHSTVNGAFAKKDQELFFSYGESSARGLAFFQSQTEVNDSNHRIRIEIHSRLPLQIQIVLILFWLLFLSIICGAIIFRDYLNQVKEAAHLQLADLAKQVAHDIRAPLSALNVVTATLQNISEDQKNLIKSASKRINDIANDLLAKGKTESAKLESGNKFAPLSAFKNIQKSAERAKPSELVVIKSALEELINEKKLGYSHLKNLTIKSDLITNELISAQLNESDLKRILSNLINNSIEAIMSHSAEAPSNPPGVVTISLRDYSKNFTITISDNGKGIPEDILPKLCEKGFSFGKNKVPGAEADALSAATSAASGSGAAVELHSQSGSASASGSGLGLYHAKTTVQSWGGDFSIKSKIGVGTMVTITLPFSRS